MFSVKFMCFANGVLIQPQNRPHCIPCELQGELHHVDRLFCLGLERGGALDGRVFQVDSYTDLKIKFTAFVGGPHQAAADLQVSDENIVDPFAVDQLVRFGLILKVGFDGLDHGVGDEHGEVSAASQVLFREQSEIHVAWGTDPSIGVLSPSFALRFSRECEASCRGDQFSGPLFGEEHGGGYVVEVDKDQLVAVEGEDCHECDLLVVADLVEEV